MVENFKFLEPSELIKQTSRYQNVVNDSGFTVKSTADIVKNVTNISSVLSNLSEEQSDIINVNILKPAVIKMETFNDLL